MDSSEIGHGDPVCHNHLLNWPFTAAAVAASLLLLLREQGNPSWNVGHEVPG
jgi:hypothetical protein